MSEEKEQWYTNKDLFEMLAKLRDSTIIQNSEVRKEMKALSDELIATRQIVSKYNGLREVIDRCELKIVDLEAKLLEQTGVALGKLLIWKGIREWGGWIFALLTLLILLGKTFLGGE